MVTEIGCRSFYNCKSLKKVTILSSPINIKKSAFNGCSSLSEFTFNDNCLILAIEEFAFRGCTSLTQIKFPSVEYYISRSAFVGCSSLSLIEIPFSVESDHIAVGWNTEIKKYK